MLFQGCMLRSWDPLQLYWGRTMPLLVPRLGGQPHVLTKHSGYVPNRTGTFMRPAGLDSSGEGDVVERELQLLGELNPSRSIFFLPPGWLHLLGAEQEVQTRNLHFSPVKRAKCRPPPVFIRLATSPKVEKSQKNISWHVKITRIPNFSGHKQGLLGHGHAHLLMAPFTRNCYRTQNLQSLNYLLFVPLQQPCANSWYKFKVTSLLSWSYYPFLSSVWPSSLQIFS